MATFKETCALMYRNLSEKFQYFWAPSSVFALEKQPKNLNCQSLFTFKKPFCGYFQ